MFIDRNDKLYFYQKNISYKCEKFSDDRFYTVVTEFLNESYANIDAESKEKLNNMFEKRKDFIQYIKTNISNAGVKTYEAQLRTYLRNDDIDIDNYTWQLHFNNGYINLKNGEFKVREFGKDYISYFINRDYTKSTNPQKLHLMGHVNKIYNNPSDKECILSLLSRCLIGMPQTDQA